MDMSLIDNPATPLEIQDTIRFLTRTLATVKQEKDSLLDENHALTMKLTSAKEEITRLQKQLSVEEARDFAGVMAENLSLRGRIDQLTLQLANQTSTVTSKKSSRQRKR